jgi:hypothetical protein
LYNASISTILSRNNENTWSAALRPLARKLRTGARRPGIEPYVAVEDMAWSMRKKAGTDNWGGWVIDARMEK